MDEEICEIDGRREERADEEGVGASRRGLVHFIIDKYFWCNVVPLICRLFEYANRYNFFTVEMKREI